MLKKFGAVCLAAVLLLTGCTLRPQENGSKSDVRWLSLTDASQTGVKIMALPRLQFTVHDYTDQACPNKNGGSEVGSQYS